MTTKDMTDGTSTINPNDNVMYLVVSAIEGRRYGAKSLRVKVKSLHEALELTTKWAKTACISRDHHMKRANVYVKGACLARVFPIKGTVERVDPVSEQSTGVVLLERGAWAAHLEATTEAAAEKSAARAKYMAAKRNLVSLFVAVLDKSGILTFSSLKSSSVMAIDELRKILLDGADHSLSSSYRLEFSFDPTSSWSSGARVDFVIGTGKLNVAAACLNWNETDVTKIDSTVEALNQMQQALQILRGAIHLPEMQRMAEEVFATYEVYSSI